MSCSDSHKRDETALTALTAACYSSSMRSRLRRNRVRNQETEFKISSQVKGKRANFYVCVETLVFFKIAWVFPYVVEYYWPNMVSNKFLSHIPIIK